MEYMQVIYVNDCVLSHLLLIPLSYFLSLSLSLSVCFSSDAGNLLLSPAPGEMFDLTVQLADQLLNYITGTVYLEVT